MAKRPPIPPPPPPTPPPSGGVVVAGTYPGFTVAAGQTVRLQGRVVSTGNVIVHGTLVMRPGDSLLFDGNPAGYVGGGHDPIPSDVGLWCIGGTLDLQGTPRTGWARNAKPANWQPADEVVVAPSSVGSTTFTLTTAGAVVMPQGGIVRDDGTNLYTEVANLTRDVVIGTLPGRAGHVFVMSPRPQTIRHIVLRDLGVFRSTPNGRYPLHIHEAGDLTGTVIEGVVVRGGKHHAFVTHLSDGITLKDCVAYDVVEEAYWWDPDTDTAVNATHRTKWHDCAAFKVTKSGSGRFGGFRLGQGIGNECVRCVAVATGTNPRNQGGFLWPEFTGADASQPHPDNGVWLFEDCVTHNTGNGVVVWQNDNSLHTVNRFTAYNLAGGGAAVNHGAYFNRYLYDGLESYGNSFGLISHALSKASPPRRQEYRDAIIDRRGRAGGVGFRCVEHNARTDGDVLLTRPVFKGFETTKDMSLQLVDDVTGGAHAYEIVDPTWSAPPGSRVVWDPGSYVAGCHVNVDGTVLVPGQNL